MERQVAGSNDEANGETGCKDVDEGDVGVQGTNGWARKGNFIFPPIK